MIKLSNNRFIEYFLLFTFPILKNNIRQRKHKQKNSCVFFVYQVNETYYFNPFSVISCLACKGLYKSYLAETGSSIILRLFEKVKEGKEEIVESLR